MNKEDKKRIEKIRESLKEITPFPWKCDMGNWEVESANKETYRYSICNYSWENRGFNEEKGTIDPHTDGQFIADAPEIITFLLTQLDEAHEALREAALEGHKKGYVSGDRIREIARKTLEEENE